MAETNHDSQQSNKQKGHKQSTAKNKASEEKNNQPSKNQTLPIGLIILTLISILLSITALAVVIYRYQQRQSQQNQLATQLTQIRQKINSQQQMLAEHSDTITQLREQLHTLKQSDTPHTNYWVLKQTEHLLTLAQYNLKFQNDTETSLAILQTIQSLLQQQSPGELIDLKTQLSSAITDIKSLAQQNVTQAVIKLNALASTIKQLPVSTAASNTDNHNTDKMVMSSHNQPKTKQHLTWWPQSWYSIKQSLLKAITIRHHKREAQPFIPPENRPFIIANVQNQLHLAQWAALHQQPQLYQNNLETAKQWLSDYFQQSDKTESVINEVNNLRRQNIAPKLPALSHLNQAVQQALASMDQQTN
jgi:uncharacterized protein HemX